MDGKQSRSRRHHGIGLTAGEALAALAANVVIVGRSETRTGVAAAALGSRRQGASVDTLIADLSAQASVRKLAAEVLSRYQRLDALINMPAPLHNAPAYQDGIELTWAVNLPAPFLLTTLLLDRLKESEPARIITTASGAHEALSAEHTTRFWPSRRKQVGNVPFPAELAPTCGGHRDRELFPPWSRGYWLQP